MDSKFPVFYTTSEAAKALKVSKRLLEKFRISGGGLLFRKLGSRVVYAEQDLLAWADSSKRSSTSDTGNGIKCA